MSQKLRGGGMKLNVAECYALAWRSFSKWWIPLCLISGVIFVFEIIPRILVRAEVNELTIQSRGVITAVLENDLDKVEEILPQITARAGLLIGKLVRLGLYVFPLIALFTIILLMYANRAVKDSRGLTKSFLFIVYVAVVHVVLAISKLLAFFFFFVPGVYVYIKLVFVSLIMLEERTGAWTAVRRSWLMTRGNFWELFLLILMNIGIQFLGVLTVLGAIPATGFANTARAAAFRMIWEEERKHRETPTP